MMDGGSDFSVLIVDDHERTRKVMATLVSHLGIAEVVTAGDAQTALAQMRERSFDLVLSDYVMSPMDGFEFKRQFDEEAGADGAAFIMVTAYDSADVIERAASEGVELLFKPFRAAALVGILSRMMGREGVKRLLN